MNRPDFSRHMEEDARLVILRELAAQTNYSLNDTLLQQVCESFGHNRSRDWVRTQIRKLADIGGVTVSETGTVLIATITQAGLDHVTRRGTLDGVARPSPGA